MQSRLNKYYDVDELNEDTREIPSRLKRNQELYKDVSNKEISSFDVNSNSSVLDSGVNSVDIEKIKEMLDRKYRELPKDKSIGSKETTIESISLDETREYDINNILEESHKGKEVNYEEDRLRKLRNTQMDILKDLDKVINGEEEKDEDILPSADDLDDLDDLKTHREEEERKLKELIDTITAQELISKETVDELDPLDLLSDLKGDNDNTKVMGVIEDTEENIFTDTLDTDTLETKKEEEQPKKEIKKEEKVEEKSLDDTKEEEKKELEDTTSTLSFTQSDFDDFNDLKEDMRFTKILIRILIVIIIIVFIIGCVILANKVFNLKLF